MSNFTTTVYPLDRDGAEHEINVRIHYDAWSDPGRVSGLPEDCYPPDGELTITEVQILDAIPPLLNDADVFAAVEDAMDRIEEEAWEDYDSLGVDDHA